MRYLLLATNNKAKVREYRSLLQNIPFELVTLAKRGITTTVSEVGESLAENARLKATALATEASWWRWLMIPALRLTSWVVNPAGFLLVMLARGLRIGIGLIIYWPSSRECPGSSAPLASAVLSRWQHRREE